MRLPLRLGVHEMRASFHADFATFV